MDKQPRKTLKARRPSDDIAAMGGKSVARQNGDKRKESHPDPKGASAAESVKKTRSQSNLQKQTKDLRDDRTRMDLCQPSTSASGSKKKVNRIQVGKAYQATLPNFISAKKSKVKADEHGAELMWKPTDKLRDDETEAYITLAKRDFGYGEEQALGLLQYHDYDLIKATRDLANFCPLPDHFTEEDKLLFNSQVVNSEKDLKRISAFFPHKPFSSLVLYYYKWKVEHEQKSKRNVPDTSLSQLNGPSHFQSQHLFPSPSTSKGRRRRASEPQKRCGNCRVLCEEGTMTYNMCNVCYVHWLKTGQMSTVTNLLEGETSGSKGGRKRKAEEAAARPKGRNNLNPNALKSLSIAESSTENELVDGRDKQTRDKKSSIQNGSQKVDEARKDLPKSRAKIRFRRMT